MNIDTGWGEEKTMPRETGARKKVRILIF